MAYKVLLFADLEEYGIGIIRGRDGTVELVGAEGVVVGDLLTSLIGAERNRPAPLFASTRFRDWYERSGLTGLAFAPAAGDLLRIRIAGVAKRGDGEVVAWDGSSFFALDGHQALLWCTDQAVRELESAGFAFEAMEPDGFLA